MLRNKTIIVKFDWPMWWVYLFKTEKVKLKYFSASDKIKDELIQINSHTITGILDKVQYGDSSDLSQISARWCSCSGDQTCSELKTNIDTCTVLYSNYTCQIGARYTCHVDTRDCSVHSWFVVPFFSECGPLSIALAATFCESLTGSDKTQEWLAAFSDTRKHLYSCLSVSYFNAFL